MTQDILARSHHSSEQRQSSAWLGSLPQPAWGDADGIEAALIACIERCTDGWVTVIAPALKLAIELISLHTKKGDSFALSFLGAHPHFLALSVFQQHLHSTLHGLDCGKAAAEVARACKQVTDPVAPHPSAGSALVWTSWLRYSQHTLLRVWKS